MKRIMLMTAAFAAFAFVCAPAFAGEMCAMSGGGMACPPSAAGCKVGMLLIALAAGYAVLALAVKQDKKTARIGKIVGWFIMVVSFVGMLCAGSKALCRMKADCDMKSSAAAACPMSGGEKSVCAMTGDVHEDKAEKKK